MNRIEKAKKISKKYKYISEADEAELEKDLEKKKKEDEVSEDDDSNFKTDDEKKKKEDEVAEADEPEELEKKKEDDEVVGEDGVVPAADVPDPEDITAKRLTGSKDQGDDVSETKIGMINAMVQNMHKMTREDIKTIYGKVMGEEDETDPEEKEKEKDKEVAEQENDDEEEDEITAKDIDVVEDINAIFGRTNLSEDFKKKVRVIFESAVVSKVNGKLKALKEERAAHAATNQKKLEEKLNTKIDEYLDYSVEHWMQDNKLAVETGLKNQIAEEFLTGLRNLFAAHYVDIPSGKENILESLADKATDLEKKLTKQIDENIRLNKRVNGFEREIAFAEMTDGLSDTQIAKMDSLSKTLEFGDVGTFKGKLKILRENYFPPRGASKNSVKSSFDEDPIDSDVSEKKYDGPEMASYVDAIARSIKK